MSEDYKKVICTIADKMNEHRANWILAGGSNLRLQGIDSPEGDIDIATDKEGAELFEELFVDYMIEPVIYSTANKRYRSYFGKFRIGNITIDVMGELEVYDTQHDKWIRAVDSRKIITKTLGQSVIFASSLDHELEIYRAEGRIDKAQLIIKDFIEKFK